MALPLSNTITTTLTLNLLTMDIAHLIAHPEELNHETIYDLRRIVAVFPTFHAARILFLRNLFLLHDPSFDTELRRAAVMLPDRSVLFEITQRNEVRLASGSKEESSHAPAEEESADGQPQKKYKTTLQLLDDFLDKTPPQSSRPAAKADPSVDYMAYLMAYEEEDGTEYASKESVNDEAAAGSTTRLDSLIDNFIDTHTERTTLSDNPIMPDNIIEEETADAAKSNTTAPNDTNKDSGAEDEECDTSFTETLARVYIRQQKYERAAEMLQKLKGTNAAQSNPYYADQVRFLQKAVINERHRKKKSGNS